MSSLINREAPAKWLLAKGDICGELAPQKTYQLMSFFRSVKPDEMLELATHDGIASRSRTSKRRMSNGNISTDGIAIEATSHAVEQFGSAGFSLIPVHTCTNDESSVLPQLSSPRAWRLSGSRTDEQPPTHIVGEPQEHDETWHC